MLFLIALISFSYMQQILVNSLFTFILLQIFLFSCYGFLEASYLSLRSTHLISKYMGFKKISLILISHFDINFSLKCFLLWNHHLCFFSLLSLLWLSMAKSKISLVKCHITLENMWVIFKYLLILTSNILLQW